MEGIPLTLEGSFALVVCFAAGIQRNGAAKMHSCSLAVGSQERTREGPACEVMSADSFLTRGTLVFLGRGCDLGRYGSES